MELAGEDRPEDWTERTDGVADGSGLAPTLLTGVFSMFIRYSLSFSSFSG
jgi:hypothetical protein